MPTVNYCRKCKAEVPIGETCAYCGAKLSNTGEQISFGVVRAPVKEWFAWNGFLRVALPVMALIFVTVVTVEACVTGRQGVIALLSEGFTTTMLCLLCGMLGLIWLLLKLQGPENVHVVMDKHGVHVRTYLPEENERGMLLRFVSVQTAEKLMNEDERPPLPGLMLIRRVSLPWDAIRRVRIWREGAVILFFRPAFWQAAAVRCPLSEFEEAQAYVRKKLKRHRKTRIVPPVKEKSRKKHKMLRIYDRNA